MVATPTAAVMLERRLSAPSRRMAAAWRRCAALACLTLPMTCRVRTHPDTYMKDTVLTLRNY
jgi:hypothetical protein